MKAKKKTIALPVLLLLLAAALCGFAAFHSYSQMKAEEERKAAVESAITNFLTAVYTTDQGGRLTAILGIEDLEQAAKEYESTLEGMASEELLEKLEEEQIPYGYDRQNSDDPWMVESVELTEEENGFYTFDADIAGHESVKGSVKVDEETGLITEFEDNLEIVVEEIIPEPEPVVQDAEGIYVCIDPGHGGIDPGTHNPAEEAHYEKDDNLALGLAVRDKLEERGAKVLMTRDDDTFYKPSERCYMANNAGVNYFICIHRNYAESDAHGIEIWISSHASEESQMLGNQLEEHLIEAGVSKSRGVIGGSQSGSGDYMVLRDTSMPGLLAEMGFMGNEEDNQLFRENLDAYADAYADAVVETWQAYHEK